MTPLEIAALVALIGVATLASYIQRVYSEYGKILSREVQENLDAWEVRIEPHLGLSREHAALCASVLKELSLGAIALGLGADFHVILALGEDGAPGHDLAAHAEFRLRLAQVAIGAEHAVGGIGITKI